MKRIENTQKGFTILELLIGLAMTGVIMVALANAYTFQAKTHEVVTGISEAQQSVTMIANLLEHDLRNAGYMVADSAAVCGVDNTTGPDVLFVSDSGAISDITTIAALESGQSNSYIASAAAGGDGLGAQLTGGAVPVKDGTSSITLADMTLDTDATYINGDFWFDNIAGNNVGAGVIVRDTNSSDHAVACGVITGIAGNTITVNWLSDSIGWASVLDVIAVPANVYQISPAIAGVQPSQLLRNGLVVANDVEDLQVEYFFDLDDNGIVSIDGAGALQLDERRGSSDTAVYSSADTDMNQFLRNVTVTVVVTTPMDDGAAQSLGRPQDVANHDIIAGGWVAANADGLRRRVVSMTVYPRNIGNESGG